MSVEYRGQFADRLGTEWTIDVENDAYSSAVKEFLMDGDPLNFEFLSPSDELLYPPVKGSMANFRVISDSHFKYAGLFAQSDFAFPVKIYQGKGSGLVVSWSNYSGYSTFTSVGSAIISAITSGSAVSYAISNNCGSIKSGDKIEISINATQNSGALPSVYLRDPSLAVISNSVQVAAGANTITLTATADSENFTVWLQTTTIASNWSTAEITAEFQQKLFWSGWIAPSSYSEPYDSTPYTVNIACTDGLGLLKNVEFKDGVEYYNGRMTEAAILFEIFDKIGITGFKEFVNIYEDNMDEAVGDSPLDQTYIDVDVFRDMNCYEVLEYLLIKWSAIIRQWEGEYYIFRPIEMSAATIYGRKFTNATTKTAITLTTGQQISRKTAETDFVSIDGGTMTIEPAAKEVIHNHDYRYKESWIDNHEFSASQFRDGGIFNAAKWWDSLGFADPNPAADYFDAETEGVYLNSFGRNPFPSTWTDRIQQTFGHYAINANPLTLYTLSFDYAFFNDKAFNQIGALYLILQTADGSHYLKGSLSMDTWEWTTVQVDGVIEINVGSIGTGPTEWVNIQKQIVGLPAAGPYIIKVLPRSGSFQSAIPFVKRIKFSEESTQLTIKKIKLTKWELFYYGELTAVARRVAKGIPIFERIFDDKKLGVERTYSETVNPHGDIYEVNHLLGDVSDSNIENVLEQFAGSLSVDIAGVQMPTTLWSRRGRADRLPLLRIAQQEYKQMYIRPVMTVALPIYDQSETPTLSLFNNLQDSLNEDQGDNRIFIPNAAEFSPKERLWNINASELIYKGVPGTIMGVTLTEYPDFGFDVYAPAASVASTPASVVCNSVSTIVDGYEYDRLNVTINYTNSGGAGSATIDWRIKNSGGTVIDSGSLTTSFPAGTGNKAITGLTYPAAGTGYTLEAKMSTEGTYDASNSFNAVEL